MLAAVLRLNFARLHLSGPVVSRTQGTSKTLDIMYKQGKWYASVVFDCEPKRKQEEIMGFIGLDWGVETFAALAHDSGEYTAIHNECHLRNELAKLKQLQRDLSRKKQLAVLHGKIARKRHEFLHQTSAKLVKENSLIAVEKLNVKGMTASGGSWALAVGAGTSRTSGDSIATAPVAFHSMLKYSCPSGCKVEETGTRYIEVPTRKVAWRSVPRFTHTFFKLLPQILPCLLHLSGRPNIYRSPLVNFRQLHI